MSTIAKHDVVKLDEFDDLLDWEISLQKSRRDRVDRHGIKPMNRLDKEMYFSTKSNKEKQRSAMKNRDPDYFSAKKF